MPYKANEAHRYKIPKARYRVENWAAYDAALRRRGDLTIWVTPEAISAWTPPATGRGGRPARYSEIAIETGLMRMHPVSDADTDRSGQRPVRRLRISSLRLSTPSSVRA